jgi:hypothetical protein
MEPSKKVSQDYFDQIVNENVTKFGMSEQEAIDDAINQLKSQGCELVNICKFTQAEQKELLEAMQSLNSLKSLNSEDDVNKSIGYLKIMKKKFEKDVSFRCLASKVQPPEVNATQIIMTHLENEASTKNNALLEQYLITFQSYLYQQSDVIDKNGLNTLIRLTQEKNYSDTSVLNYLLKCLSTTCQMNESNRQHLVENGLCENLMEIFKKHKTNNDVLCEACHLIRNLLLDDDMRVEFSNAHETAKYIASKLNGLDVLLSIGLGTSCFIYF